MQGLSRLCNVPIVGYFYYLIVFKLLHVSVVRPSSGRNILARITRLTTDPLFLEYSYIIVIGLIAGCCCNIFLPEDGRTTVTCSILGSIK
jgi:hypothetical protein